MTVKTLTEIQSEINTLLADNTTANISPANIRGLLTDLVGNLSEPSSVVSGSAEALHKTRLYATVAQTIDYTSASYTRVIATQNNNPVKVAFDSIDYNVGGIAELVDDRAVIKRTGFYSLASIVTVDDGSSGSQLITQIIKNGVMVADKLADSRGVTQNNITSTIFMNQIYLVAGDVIEVFAKRYFENNPLTTVNYTNYLVSLEINETTAETTVLEGSVPVEENGFRVELTEAGIQNIWSIATSAMGFETEADGGGLVMPHSDTIYSNGWTIKTPTATEWVEGSSTLGFLNQINNVYFSPNASGLYRIKFAGGDFIDSEVNNTSQGALVPCIAINGSIVQYFDVTNTGRGGSVDFVQQINVGDKLQVGYVSGNLDGADLFTLAEVLNETDTHFSSGAKILYYSIEVDLAEKIIG